MPDYKPIETDLSVVYPPGRQLSAKVRSFVDFLAARFAGEPECDRWRTGPPAIDWGRHPQGSRHRESRWMIQDAQLTEDSGLTSSRARVP